MSDFETFIASTLVAALIGTGFGFWSDKKLSSFKDTLQRRLFEHQTRFASLHEKRAQIIAKLYKQIINTNRLIKNASLPLPTFIDAQGAEEKDTRGDIAFNAYIEFLYFFNENRIYFTKKQCEMLDGLSGLMATGSMATLPFQKDILDDETREFVKTRLKDALTDIPPVLESLEDTFRELLGIELGDTQDSES